MIDRRPGLDPRYLRNLMHAAITRCQLHLTGAVVLTEAATGAYVVTPILAAMAGAAQVYAVTRATRYGAVAEVTEQTMALARLAGVAERITILTEKRPAIVAEADIVTNSGHLRPLDAATIAMMKPTAVIPVMYEAWELRPTDIDLAACQRRGILVGDTNERHPAVDVFSFLGIMAVKLLLDAGIAVYRSRVLLLSDNHFGPYMERGLVNTGATVDLVAAVTDERCGEEYDAIVVALHPGATPVLEAAAVALIAQRWPGVVVAQFWGDLDRSALAAAAIPCWPLEAPPAGHMGILPSAVGPEPVVRLQTGGLKTSELLWRWRQAGLSTNAMAAALKESNFGTLVI